MLHEGGHDMPWVWFRAILDWFEEVPVLRTVNKPATRVIGAERPAGMFKAPPVRAAQPKPAASE